MTTETTQPAVAPMDLVRLRRSALVLQLMAAHPEVAAAPIDWEINAREDGLWGQAPFGIPEAEATAQILAAALGAKVETRVLKNGQPMYQVYGRWAGEKVSLHAWGPTPAEADEVAAPREAAEVSA